MLTNERLFFIVMFLLLTERSTSFEGFQRKKQDKVKPGKKNHDAVNG